MMRFPVQPKSARKLEEIARPPSGKGITEAIPFIYYDTAEYIDNTTQNLVFFTETRANRNLSNLSPAGSLPTPYYFEIFGFCLDVLLLPAAANWTDVWSLILGDGTSGAPFFNFTMSDKTYGPYPLSALHATGGITGFSDAAAAPIQSANNASWDGGFFTDGAIVIPPNESFRAEIQWAEPVDITGDTRMRVSMYGTLHRKVL
jgi:hypothetical protein